MARAVRRCCSTLCIAFGAALAGCGTSATTCPVFCEPAETLEVTLTCPSDEVVANEVTGACAGGSGAAGLTCVGGGGRPFVDCTTVEFRASAEGDCHVHLEFKSGFTYDADVHFARRETCTCKRISPDPAQLRVASPSSTCPRDSGAGDAAE